MASNVTEDENRIYIAIDLKSFYASVECMERGLDPLTANLVVADASRTEKTICLAVTPALKSFGISGRARLFEVVQRVKEINKKRLALLNGNDFSGESYISTELNANKDLRLSYIAAPPRMALYMKYSTDIYKIYLRYVSAEDVHVYSVDEVFIDVTSYLEVYKMTARELAMKMIKDVLIETGITATAGIGTNLYLCKIAMDIVAKHIEADEDGVRIAELNVKSYRELLWGHRPLTDFWRVGKGYAKKLEANGIYTMGDVARCSIGTENDYYNEDLLYKLFGINAELLIDHAWGYEPCTIAEIKKYKPETNSLSAGQVLHCAYDYEKTRLIIKEMTDQLVLDLVSKKLLTDQLVLTVGYDIENLTDPEIMNKYNGEITIDHYGRKVPKHAHGTIHLPKKTSSTKMIMDAMLELFERIINKDLLTRRITVVADKIVSEESIKNVETYEQMDLFSFAETINRTDKENETEEKKAKELSEKEKRLQEAVLSLKKKYGKNAMLKGMNLEEGGTAIDRNAQIGGHRA